MEKSGHKQRPRTSSRGGKNSSESIITTARPSIGGGRPKRKKKVCTITESRKRLGTIFDSALGTYAKMRKSRKTKARASV